MAFNFIPNDRTEIHNKFKGTKYLEDINHVYNILQNIDSSIPNPLSMDLSSLKKNKPVKIIRSMGKHNTKIEKEFGIKFNNALSAKYGNIRLSYGNGSRGNRGSNNRGTLFEYEFFNDLETINKNSNDEIKYAKIIKKLFRSKRLNRHEEILVTHQGKQNNKRPLCFVKNNIFILTQNYKKTGSILSDITLNQNNKSHYLSLKMGPTTVFFNCGVRTILKKSEMEKGYVDNENGQELLNLFGIDHQRLIDIFKMYGRKTNIKSEIIIPSINEEKISKFLKSGVGSGYTIIHKKNHKSDVIHCENIYKSTLDKFTNIKSIKIQYPHIGKTKGLNVLIETERLNWKICFKNNQSGIFPSHIFGDYKFK